MFETAYDWLVHPLWQARPRMDWPMQVYRVFNFVEAGAWFLFAGLVLRRWAINRKSPLELPYAAAFALFGLTDLREAFVLQPWLILAKGAILFALLALRRFVLRRHYPSSRMF